MTYVGVPRRVRENPPGRAFRPRRRFAMAKPSLSQSTQHISPHRSTEILCERSFDEGMSEAELLLHQVAAIADTCAQALVRTHPRVAVA